MSDVGGVRVTDDIIGPFVTRGVGVAGADVFLLSEFENAGQDEPVGEDPEWLEARQMECKKFIQSGLVDTLNRY